jgi:transcription initiation factor TFIIIB Brf1 subunit/transcription initiation factor TFIIB
MTKKEFTCFNCGIQGSEEVKEYQNGDYEALVCTSCGCFHDFAGFQEATDWSMDFVNLDNSEA